MPKDSNYLAVLILASTLAGCSTALTVDQEKADLGKLEIYYSYVVGVFPAKEAGLDLVCSQHPSAKEKFPDASPSDLEYARNSACKDLSAWSVAMTNFYGKYGKFAKKSILIPASAGVEVDDIVKFHLNLDQGVAPRFISIAAKSAEKSTKNCDWVGSKILNIGGVECEGWSYKNLPVFKS